MTTSTERQLQQILNRLRRLEDERAPAEPEGWLLGASASFEYFWPPSGGIPAAVGTTSTLQTGVGLCFRARKTSDGRYERLTQTELVENEVGYIVGLSGKPIGCIKNIYGRYTVIIEDCSSSSGGGGPISNPPVPDPISANSSKSLSIGFTLGV